MGKRGLCFKNEEGEEGRGWPWSRRHRKIEKKGRKGGKEGDREKE